MNKSIARQTVFPLLAALIWGTAFVAQSVSTDYVPPFAFNAIRSVIAFFFLLALSGVMDGAAKRRGTPVRPTNRKQLALGGLCCGAFLAVAANLQQVGIADTAAGKAGFITALYVVLVPVFGIFLRRRATPQVWVSVAVAVAGLYLLCVKGAFSLQKSDLILIACAVFFSGQILCVDHFVRQVDGIKLSCAQFLVTGIISGVLSAIFETPTLSGALRCVWPLLYVAIFSSGVAYTLQILAQKDADPTVVTLLLSTESVFSVLAGAVILGDRLSGREYAGCVLMFAAVVLAQIPLKRRRAADESSQCVGGHLASHSK